MENCLNCGSSDMRIERQNSAIITWYKNENEQMVVEPRGLHQLN